MRSWILVALGLCLGAPSVGAQPAQYTAPGGGQGEGTKTKQQIETEMEEARWNLGPIRLVPWAGLRNLTYVGNVFASSGNETSDVTGSVGAGLTAYLPTGPKVFWIAQAQPEYVFWLDLEDRRELVGRYGAGVFADLNRLGLAANATRVEEQAVVSSETEQLSLAKRDRLALDLDLHLTAAIDLFASGSLTDVRDEGAVGDGVGPPLELLQREERGVRGGVRYRVAPLAVELGAEVAEVEFEPGARDLSNRGTSPFVRLRLEGNRIGFDVELIQRSMEPLGGSRLVPVDATSGSLRVTITPGWRFTLSPYGRRSTVYSLATGYSHFTEDRLGFAVEAPFDRVGFRAFAEVGENDYEAISGGGAPSRTDDYSAWGLGFDVEVREWLRYRGGFHHLEYDSQLPGFDRTIDRFESSINLSLQAGTWIWR